MARSMPSTPLASTRSAAPAANTRSASSTSPQHHPPNQPQLGSIHHPQNQIGVSTLGSQSRRKESSLASSLLIMGSNETPLLGKPVLPTSSCFLVRLTGGRFFVPA